MSVMEKLFGAFTGSQQQQQQTQQQPQPGNIPAGSGATSPTNTTVPEGGAPAPEAKAPLADFAKLWEAPENTPQPEALFGNVDPQKLMEAAGKTDFSKVITPEQLQAINAGGEGAMAAMMQAMNKMSQAVYANSAMATTKIVDQALKKAQEQFNSQIPTLVKQHTVSDTLRTENPIFSNPAVAPLVEAMKQQFTLKHPNATAGEIAQMTKTYISDLGQVFNPTKVETKNTAANGGEPDWDNLFGVKS